MSFINPQAKEVNCKIAYFGAQGAGKSSSLHTIYEKTAPGHRGKIVSLSDEQEGSLFFDFLPLSLGKVKGYTIRFHLYTVPGHVIYESSRKIILKGLDGVVFVVDSRIERTEENLESGRNRQASLKNHEINFQTIPNALQYNKRDLPNILPLSDLQTLFNSRSLPEFETVAKEGRNVMECLQAVAKKVLVELKK